ncbi:MAG: hypothetical protein K0R43_1695 [Pseudoduganella sp.]|jgi:hypothetical protein|nr:hypothetical protein [Pseudoduganella sp.]
MAKLILGKPPKTISKDLTFPMLDGTTGSIKVDFKYRTRSDYAKFVDDQAEKVKVQAEAELAAMKAKAAEQKEAGTSIDLGMPEADMQARKTESQADFILGALDGWNLDIPFDREAVVQLVDEVPQAAQTIIAAYREAMTEGRLGN